jgi:hypothetical protein
VFGWPALRQEDVPIRVSLGRFRLWGLGLVAMSAAVIMGSPANGFIDFPQFWVTGRLVGTSLLLDAPGRAAWELARGIKVDYFLYLPGAAWAVGPLANLPVDVAFWVYAAVLIAAACLAAAIGARAYRLDLRVALLATLAWPPILGSAALGHNEDIGLLLALLAIWALSRDRDGLAGIAVALLLYKPTLALPLLGLLLLRRRWVALGVVVLALVPWYLISVLAAAGDWQWPIHLANGISTWYGADANQNTDKAVSVVGLLIGMHLPSWLCYGVGGLFLLVGLPRLVRAPIPEAGAGALVLGLVVSPHALNYEAVMLLPIMLWAAGRIGTGLAEPWRTRLVVPAYPLAFGYILSPSIGLSSLVIITAAAAVVWIAGWQRQAADTVSEAGAT